MCEPDGAVDDWRADVTGDARRGDGECDVVGGE
jgi:hypothetical protein